MKFLPSRPAAIDAKAGAGHHGGARRGQIEDRGGDVFDRRQTPGGDIAEQAEIAFTNVLKRLAEVGASASDIVKTNVYIKAIDPERVRAAGGAQARVFQLDPSPVSTWVGVTGLIYSQLLIEVEATAVVEAD